MYNFILTIILGYCLCFWVTIRFWLVKEMEVSLIFVDCTNNLVSIYVHEEGFVEISYVDNISSNFSIYFVIFDVAKMLEIFMLYLWFCNFRCNPCVCIFTCKILNNIINEANVNFDDHISNSLNLSFLRFV